MNTISEIKLIGGDPEFFCINKATGKYISLIPYIKGTKKNPKKIDIEGCYNLKDNVSIEFNIKPTPEYWMYHTLVSDCMDYTNKWLSEIDSNYQLDITSSAYFDDNELDHPLAQEFGCEPSYTIYADTVINSSSIDPTILQGLRSAAYHIHYGLDKNYPINTLKDFVFLNDLFLGFPALFLDNSDRDRKVLYGKLGDHRLKYKNKEYNEITETNRIEYRTLGAGIFKFPGFINNGINRIKKNLENTKYFKDLYFELFLELYHSFGKSYQYDLEIYIKKELIKNGHYNG